MACLPTGSRSASTVRSAMVETAVRRGTRRYGSRSGPPFPFHTISIDHKTVAAPRSTGYHYILVGVDMLTRFVTAIPTETISAEETLTALMEHVLRSTPFRWFTNQTTELLFGTSSWPENGMAEHSVGRITHLLVRHTQQFATWPAAPLPMITFAMICTDHLSLGTSPFFAS
eukprot:6186395-Pleurochrysis_carterae.AAC.5